MDRLLPMKGSPATSLRPSGLKPEILAATERLIRSSGLSGATTRAIAREAGCSEGSLYVHFQDRTALLVAVLQETLMEMKGPLRLLDGKAGHGTVQGNLEAAMRGMYKFHERAVPMLGGLFSEPDLLAAFRKSLLLAGKGPHLAMARLSHYIEEEQALGRIPPANSVGLATTLMGACFFNAFTQALFGDSAFVNAPLEDLISTLCGGKTAPGNGALGQPGSIS